MDKKKIVILVSGLILLVIIFIPGYLRTRELNRKNGELKKQIKEIRQANKELKGQQQKLLNDPVYLEEVARKKMGVARKGEVIYKVLPEQKK